MTFSYDAESRELVHHDSSTVTRMRIHDLSDVEVLGDIAKQARADLEED